MEQDSKSGTKLFIIIITFVLLVVFLIFIFKVLVFLGYNTFFFLDNLVNISSFNPILSWGILGLFFGSILGAFIAIRKYNLSMAVISFPIITVILILIVFGFVNKPNAYTWKTLSKEEVAFYEEKEKESKTNSTNTTPYNNNSSNDIKTDAASEKILSWINSLGKRDFKSAYSLMNKKKYGNYDKFSSKKGYGGITSTSVYSCQTDIKNNCSYEVVADYEAIDPYNKSGRYKQRFFINSCSGYWEITKIQNIKVENY